MRWAVGLAVFLVVVFGMNATLIYLAVSGAEPVAASYERER